MGVTLIKNLKEVVNKTHHFVTMYLSTKTTKNKEKLP